MYDKQFIFIVGAPRSGTTWLTCMIGDHPRVVSLSGESTLFCTYVRQLETSWRLETRNKLKLGRTRGLPNHIEATDFSEAVRAFVDKVYDRILAPHSECTHYVEKAPDNAFAVELIDAYIPGAKFVHLIRDGRDMAVSYVSTRKRKGWGARSIAEGAKVWKDSVAAARNARAFGERYLEIRYEHLVSRCEEELAHVFAFCGLSAEEQLVHEIAEAHHFSKVAVSSPNPDVVRGNGVPPWQQLMSPLERHQFDCVAGDLLQELGYADRSWWHRNPGEKALIEWQSRLRSAGNRVRKCKQFLANVRK